MLVAVTVCVARAEEKDKATFIPAFNPSPYSQSGIVRTTLPPNPTADTFPPYRPDILNRPTQPGSPISSITETLPDFQQTPIDPPLGFSGRSGVEPSIRPDKDYVPIEDRWRIGFPEWNRYNYSAENPKTTDYPYVLGRWWDPFNQNVLKGDYPIIGQYTFLNITAMSNTTFEGRQIPLPTTPFESTSRPFQEEFFGRPNQFLFQQYFRLSFDLFHGDAPFKPVDWRIKFTPVFNINYLDVDELAIVSPDVTKGTDRGRTFTALEEYFVEAKLLDLSSEYDFLSIRLGSQFFSSDFRGFILSETNRAVRLFGTQSGNRDQFNLIYLRPTEKNINSELNTFNDRPQNIVVGNYYRQDFIFPGYTLQGSMHYNNDRSSTLFDSNGFLARPDPVGVFQPHTVDAVYFGFAGDGHIGRYNINHAFYWAIGHDSLNPIANQPQEISAQMAAIELSYDRDWARFRSSFFWSSGDGNAKNRHATGFDSIFDNPNFAGGEFSYWQRQNLPLFGVNLTQRQSLVPDLRSSKVLGQSNFVNPGLLLFNSGVDMDLTPKVKMINNANFLMFDKTNTLETFLFDGHIDREIGVDLSTAFEYRPLLSNNVILTAGVNTLIPANGFKQIYNRIQRDVNPLMSGFIEMQIMY